MGRRGGDRSLQGGGGGQGRVGRREAERERDVPERAAMASELRVGVALVKSTTVAVKAAGGMTVAGSGRGSTLGGQGWGRLG